MNVMLRDTAQVLGTHTHLRTSPLRLFQGSGPLELADHIQSSPGPHRFRRLYEKPGAKA